MSAENRLSREELAALQPGDTVTIESGQEFGRRRYSTGTVVRVVGSCITVCSVGPRGGKYVEKYGLRDGFRVSGGTRAELVTAQPDDRATRDLLVRQTWQIDVLYRAWTRRRDDVEALRELHGAIGAYLGEQPGI
jgi:hypothetical protein